MTDHLSRHDLTEFEVLSEARRAAALEHLDACAACRTAWLSEDESRVFALLARAPISEDRLEALSARISDAVDRLDTAAPPRRSWSRVASIAASLMLALGLGAVLWEQEPVATAVALPVNILPAQLQEELAGMELVTSPGEDPQVLKLDIGDKTQVLMIFDSAIEL